MLSLLSLKYNPLTLIYMYFNSFVPTLLGTYVCSRHKWNILQLGSKPKTNLFFNVLVSSLFQKSNNVNKEPLLNYLQTPKPRDKQRGTLLLVWSLFFRTFYSALTFILSIKIVVFWLCLHEWYHSQHIFAIYCVCSIVHSGGFF